jgi:subtilase family serine protease
LPATTAGTTALIMIAAVLAALSLTAASSAAGHQATAGATLSATGRAGLAGTHPAWAIAGREVARPDAAAPVTARVYLAGRDKAGLAAYASAVATPGSPDYRAYLSAGQERQRFGPTAAQTSAVRRWLTGAGLRVTSATEHYLAVTGPASAMDSAFAVRLGTFRTSSGGVAMAPQQQASVPDSVASAVLTVTGLDTQALVMHPALPGPPDGFYAAGPCSSYYGQKHATGKPKAYGKHVPWAICGYKPAQLRAAYGLSGSLSTGKGITVAIVDAYASPTMPADADIYSAAVGQPAFSQTQFRQILPSAYDSESECGASGWYGEETLDIEAVHAMAPGANIVYVGASDCTFGPLLDGLTSIVDNHLADIVTDSWNGEEADVTTPVTDTFDQIFEQGATEGIGFDFSSGDCGYNDPATSCGESEDSSASQVSYPPSSPWVTGVGGTTLAVGRGGKYEWETGWGDMVVNQDGKRWKPSAPGPYPASFAFGGGGGTSTLYQQPSFQAGVVPRSLATRLPDGQVSATAMREVPDVAMDADPATGFLYGETVKLRGGKDGFQLSRIGGTSLASPLFAGLEADAAQNNGAGSLGFINPALYALAGTSAFHDVTDDPLGAGVRIAAARNEFSDSDNGTGKILSYLYTFAIDGEGKAALKAAKGYDDVTGLGSPARGFLTALAGS